MTHFSRQLNSKKSSDDFAKKIQSQIFISKICLAPIQKIVQLTDKTSDKLVSLYFRMSEIGN